MTQDADHSLVTTITGAGREHVVSGDPAISTDNQTSGQQHFVKQRTHFSQSNSPAIFNVDQPRFVLWIDKSGKPNKKF